MALDNLSEQRIQETYQKLVQTENGKFATGDGTAISIVTSDTTGSFAHKSAISGAFADASHSLQDRIETLEGNPSVPANTVSSSAQLASDISGAFVAPSSSFSTRVTALKSDSGSFSTRTTNLKTDSGSFSTRVTNLKTDSGSFEDRVTNLKTDSSSFSTRISSNETDISLLTTATASFLKNTTDTLTGNLTITGKLIAEEYIVSSSVTNLLTQQLSGSTKFGDTSDDTHQFTGSIFLSGSSIQLNGNDLLPFTATSISQSLGVNADLIRSLTEDIISGSFTEASHSLQSRLATAESELGNTLISGSAQIATEISGAFVAASHSLQSRLSLAESELSNTLISGSAQIKSEISGAFVAASHSLQSRLTTAESELGNTLISGSAQIATEISGAFVAPSSSFSTRVTNLESTSSNRIFNHVTASGRISASGNISMMSASIGGGIFTSASLAQAIAGGGTGVGFPYSGSDSVTNLPAQAIITGSLLIGGGLGGHITASGISASNIKAINVNAGTPTSNNWKENLQGSYFNNFDANTDISEILRFIAGAMSHSLDVSDAAPNTKIYGSVSTTHTQGSTITKSSLLNGVLGSTYENARLSQHWTASAFIDFSETASYKAVQNYLQLKGWFIASDRGTFGNDTGTNPFHGTYASRIPSPILTNATFDTNTFSVSANTSGTSNVSSADNTFGLGALDGGAANTYNVRVIASHSFSDNYTDSTPDASSTFHTASFKDYTQTSFGTSADGLTLTKIVTSQPAVIPSAFQDGDFNSVAGTISGRYYTGGSQNQNSISASGNYSTHDIKVGLKSGSQSDFTFKNGTDSTTRFYLYTGGLPSDITNGTPTAVVTKTLDIASFSATSRSLSGAPYILTCTYTIDFDSEVSKSFDPGYGYSSEVLKNSNPTDDWESVGSTTLSNTSCNVDQGGINGTPSDHRYVIDRTKTTKRANNTIPHISDIAVVSSSFTFELDSNSTNISQNRSSNQSLNYDLTFRARGRNWKGSSQDSSTSASPTKLYDAGRFTQNTDSGSMAIYSFAQGHDDNFLEDSTETFTGEDNRIILADNVLNFNGVLFTTNVYKTNDNHDAVIGQLDLQIKPGYLVNPIGTRGYWFTTDSLPGSVSDSRFYVRKFKTNGQEKGSISIHLSNKSLVNWTSTAANSIACAILFESSANGSGNRGGSGPLSKARIYDPTSAQGEIDSDIATDDHKNPFTPAIELYGCPGSVKSASNIYTFNLLNSNDQFLDSNDDEFYVIVRYKGDPAPIQQINVSTS
tara:strand:+ start:550 stop:4329 length:3780 start_codon:yes stop_codon:yes gene_type:complete